MKATSIKRNKILIILGMHRSGTSVFTNWLSTCGLMVGDHLIGSRPSNPYGHFEDTDFVQFHDAILKENGMDTLTGLENKRIVSPYFRARAKGMLSFKSALYSQWGWKDPRTCLFLPLWQEIIPTATYIVLFRGYQQVIESLLRRDFQRIGEKYKNGWINRLRLFTHRRRLRKKCSTLANQYLASWCHYNERLLDFLEKNNRTILIYADNIKGMEKEIFDYLLKNGFELNHVPFNSLFNPKYWNTSKKNSFNYFLDKDLRQKAEDVLLKLNTLYKRVPIE